MRLFSGVFAVGVVLAAVSAAQAQLSPYFQDFEGLDPNDFSVAPLGGDGWLVGANVFDPNGSTFLYNYFAFPAPNGSGAFSNVLASGAPVGNQGLVVFSDYGNADHGIGNRIEANVFQEQTVGAGDVGKTAVFEFVAAPGDLGGDTTALAFIKTLDPNAGFALTNFLTFDTTSLPSGNTSASLSLPIDSSLPGQIFQFGFLNVASNFDPSGVNYDNVSLSIVPEPGTISLSALGACALLLRKRRNCYLR